MTADGTIRVLHDDSFVDDPTRIFRAVRYESRFGFRMDEHTESLARAGDRRQYVRRLSAARLREELIELLDEGEADASIVRLGELGVGRRRSIRSWKRTRRAPACSHVCASWMHATRSTSRTGGLGSRRSHASFGGRMCTRFLHRLDLRKRDARHIAAAVTDGPRAGQATARRRAARIGDRRAGRAGPSRRPAAGAGAVGSRAPA